MRFKPGLDSKLIGRKLWNQGRLFGSAFLLQDEIDYSKPIWIMQYLYRN